MVPQPRGIAFAISSAILAVSLIAAADTPARADSSKRWPTLDGNAPLVIAHRGASGYFPEETLEAYRLAIAMGVDVVEPDIVVSKDGALIARHDVTLATSTDVATHPEFASRRRAGEDGDGGPVAADWFVADFTLAELKTLGAHSPNHPAAQKYDGLFHIVTFQEILDLIALKEKEAGIRVAIYPETKNPSYHLALFRAGLIRVRLEDALMSAIVANGLNRRDAPIFVQSFEPTSLQYMRSIGSRVRQVQLIDAFDVDFRNGGLIFGHEPDHLEFSQPTDWKLQGRTDLFDVMLTPAGLAEIATYADGIGPWKPMVVPVKCKLDNAGNCRDLDGNGTFDGYPDAIQQQPTTLVRDAHRASSRHRRAIEGPARRGGVPGTFRRVRRRWQALSVGLSRRERGAPTQRRDLHPHRIDPREREMAIARERIADRPAVRAGRESFRRRAVTRGKGQQARMKWAPGGALVLHRCNYV